MAQLLFYLWMGHVSIAQACKCDFAPVKDLYKNPIAAATAFVAVSEGKGKDRVFKVIQSWTPYQAIYKSPDQSKCSLKTEPDHTYLIYSLGTPEAIEKRGIGFTVCDSYAAEIEDAEPIIEKLSAKSVRNDLSPNPSWFYCTRKSECGKVKGVCSDPAAVNKKYRQRFKLWAQKAAPSVNCVVSSEKPTGKVLCRQNFCEAEMFKKEDLPIHR